MERYVKGECGNVVRYRKELTGERCPRCERRLVDGKAVNIGVWLGAHGFNNVVPKIPKDQRGLKL